LILFVALLLVALPQARAALVTGGTGPGGFESTTSASGVLYWLKADVGITLNGSSVAAWGDQSSQHNDFTQSDTIRQPTYVASGINGLPAVQFTIPGSPTYTNTQKLMLVKSTQPQTAVIVNTTTGGSGIWGLTNPDNVTISDVGIRGGWAYPGNGNDFTNPAGSTLKVNGGNTSTRPSGTPHIVAANRSSSTTFSPATGLGDYFVYDSSQLPRAWAGSIGEVVVYNRALNSAEQTVLENSLSAKYGITLDTANGAVDYYAGDTAGNGSYTSDVFGIGRINAASQLTTAGAAGFGIEAAAPLADGAFVMAGHKVASNSRVTANAPTGLARWNRAWYVDKTNAADVRAGFDSANAGLTAAAGNTGFTLLYSSTATGTFAPVAATATVSGTQVAFNLPDAQLADGYYTLGEAAPITGRTGPGGLEATNTNSSLLYWLKADAGVTKDGSNKVAAWADQTSRGNSFSQATAQSQPLFQASGFGGNSLSALHFDGDNSDPDGSTGPLLVGAYSDKLVLSANTTPRTVFLVNNTLACRSLDGIWGGNNTDTGIRRQTASNWQSGSNGGNNNDYTYTGSMFVNGSAGTASSGPHILTAIGNNTFAATNIGNYFPYGHAAGSRSWNGDLAEVIVYDRVLNSAEQSIVENSLSAKYGIALTGGDHYLGDDPAQGNYDLDVFGIGRVDAANAVYNSGTAGFGIMALNGSLGDGEWVMAGHKTPVNGLVADSGYLRWTRDWYLDVTGSVDLGLTFDSSDAGLTMSGSPALALLYRSSSASAFTGLGITGTLVGDQITFQVPAGLLADGFFAVGIVPEPTAWLLLALGSVALLFLRRRTSRA
jgi:hypothetical protein